MPQRGKKDQIFFRNMVARLLLDMQYPPEQIDHLLTLETGPVLLSWKLALGHAEIR